MKTSIQKFIALTLTVVALTSSVALAATPDNAGVTVLTQVKKVSKINVSGNVELILVQSENESVKVYNNYYAKNALVQQKNGELRISSFDKETLTVIVYVNSLTDITASDNAKISTYGKFNTLSLEVNLKDKATANLNLHTVNLATTVSDESTLNLAGSTDDYLATLDNLGKVNMGSFVAQSTNIQSKNIAAAKISPFSQLPIAE